MTEFVRLGSAYDRPTTLPEPEPSTLDILAELKRAILLLPAPVVQGVTDEDVRSIVQSVIALAGPKPLSEKELAAAIVEALPPPVPPLTFPEIPVPPDPSDALNRLADRLEEQMHVLRGLSAQSAQAFGSSGPSNISSDPNREIGRISNFPADYPDSTAQSTLAAIKAKTDNLDVLLSTRTKPADEQKSRDRDENAAFLYHDAGGVVSVAAATWVTLASITVPAGKTLRLLMAEGDLAGLGAINNSRGLRVRQGTTVKAAALVGADQPNPDIEGLTLANTSGGNETWDVQGRHGSLTSQDMVGWFTWTEVND